MTGPKTGGRSPFPSFELEPLAQVYRRVAERTYRYESGGGSFTRTLEVNDTGFVTSYPGLWEAEAVDQGEHDP